MTKDELKNKIAKFICNACEMGLGAGFDGDECAINQNYWECCICGETADALIAAGIGDVKAAEHRAEVAEKALERTVVELLITQGYSALMAVIRAEEFFIPEAIKEAEKELSEAEE